MQCNWNKTWTPVDSLDACVWTQCIRPPQPPEYTLLSLDWDGSPVEFSSNVSYVCGSDDAYFESNREAGEWNLTCLDDGTWEDPKPWPVCLRSILSSKLCSLYKFTGVNCSSPPPRPSAGTWEWDGALTYLSSATYTCGPYGDFIGQDGASYGEVVAECAWNKTWVPPVLDECAATYCQVVPFPPARVGMEYVPSAESSMSFTSKYSRYNPPVPYKMSWPDGFCDGAQKLLLVGNVVKDHRRPKLPEIFLQGEKEEYHVLHLALNPEKELISRWPTKLFFSPLCRWAVDNGSVVEQQGEEGEGTSIDLEEPFVLSISCDPDGWILQVTVILKLKIKIK